MRRLVAQNPVTASTVLLAAALGALLAAGLAAAPTAAHRLLAPSPCTLTPTFEHPAGAAVGAEIPLTLTLKAGCPAGAYGPLHIALLVQASETFARNPDSGEYLRGDVQASIRNLVARLDLPSNPWIKIGLVQYNDRAQRLCDLTNDAKTLDDCIDDLAAKGETRLDTAVKEAVNVLKRGRAGAGTGLREFVVLYSDGVNDYTDPRTSMPPAVAAALDPAQQPTAGCDSVIKELDEVRADNPDVVWSTVCVKCEQACLRRIATSLQFMGDIANTDRLYTYYDQLANAMGASPLARLDITGTFGAGITVDTSTGSPPPVAIDAERIAWQLLRTRDQERVRWSVRASQPGPAVPLCSALVATFVDNRAGAGVLEIPCPPLAVTGGTRPTDPSPTATPTPEATEPLPATPTAVPTEPPTATPTVPPEGDIYLPATFRGHVRP